MSTHVGTYQHMSACPNVPTHQHADKVQRVRIKDTESDGRGWHMSGRKSTCRHILAHVGMSRCADTCQHADKILRVVSDMPRVMVHVGTCRHMSACPHVLTHASLEVRSKWLVSEVPRVKSHVGTCRHMSAHVGTRHISAPVGMSTCADTY